MDLTMGAILDLFWSKLRQNDNAALSLIIAQYGGISHVWHTRKGGSNLQKASKHALLFLFKNNDECCLTYYMHMLNEDAYCIIHHAHNNACAYLALKTCRGPNPAQSAHRKRSEGYISSMKYMWQGMVQRVIGNYGINSFSLKPHAMCIFYSKLEILLSSKPYVLFLQKLYVLYIWMLLILQADERSCGEE